MADSMETTIGNSSVEHTTQFFHQDSAVEQRDLGVNVGFGLIGLFVFLFNGSLLFNYYKHPKIRPYYSFLMMNLFIFCTIHGLVAGIIFPLHRVNRYTHSDFLCSLGVVIMEFCDNYILVLLPLLAVERLLDMVYTKMSFRLQRRYGIGAAVFAFVFTSLYALLPLVPNIGVNERDEQLSSNPNVAATRSKFYKAFTCNGNINRRNTLSPIFMLIIQILCVITTISCFVYMFIYDRRTRYDAVNLTTTPEQKRKEKARKAAVSIALLSFTFIVMTLPYGILLNIRDSVCSDDNSERPEWCQHITLSLRFIFGILQHCGELFAPMFFAFFYVNIRKSYLATMRCQPWTEEVPASNSLPMDKTETTGY